ncbi:hypothetical protein BDV12DRAFT_165985 [Aspergillus spectabilis]
MRTSGCYRSSLQSPVSSFTIFSLKVMPLLRICRIRVYPETLVEPEHGADNLSNAHHFVLSEQEPQFAVRTMVPAHPVPASYRRCFRFGAVLPLFWDQLVCTKGRSARYHVSRREIIDWIGFRPEWHNQVLILGEGWVEAIQIKSAFHVPAYDECRC